MKKFIYSVLLALIVSLSLYSCTEEVVKPVGNTDGALPQEIIRK